LESYRVEVEKARDTALALAAKARQDAIADTERWRSAILAASTAAAATPRAAIEAANAVPTPPRHVEIPRTPIPVAPKALKEMKAPRWDKAMEQLDVTDEELIAGNARMKFILPTAIATVAIIAIASVYSVMHRAPTSDVVHVGKSQVVATPPTTDSARIPRAGFLSQPTPASTTPAAVQTSPLITPPPTTPGTRIDSAAGAVARTPPAPPPATPLRADSAQRPRERESSVTPPSSAAATRRRPSQHEIDSVNTAPAEWAQMQRADSIMRARREAQAHSDSLRRDSVARPDTTSRLD
ncbi:MAG TPA: hypothetical protein VGM50_13785, partial [Gemmatimonadaceae bacterium]